MAKFELQIPKELSDGFERLYADCDDLFGAMVKAGADVVLENIKANVPASFHGSNIMNCLKVSEVYKTPSDDGINCKVGFYGYFINEAGESVPAPLVANVFEYGRSAGARGGAMQKKPFLRKSFNAGQIENAMLNVQNVRLSKNYWRA